MEAVERGEYVLDQGDVVQGRAKGNLAGGFSEVLVQLDVDVRATCRRLLGVERGSGAYGVCFTLHSETGWGMSVSFQARRESSSLVVACGVDAGVEAEVDCRGFTVCIGGRGLYDVVEGGLEIRPERRQRGRGVRAAGGGVENCRHVSGQVTNWDGAVPSPFAKSHFGLT